MFCEYCTKFQDSQLREEERNTKGKITYQTRYCPHKDNMMRGIDNACEDLVFVSIFWCDKYDQQRYVSACLKRRIKDFENCSKCNQGKTITKTHYSKEKPILIKRGMSNGK